MTHDPALHAHEHREHAAHAALEHDRFISLVSITIAVLAVLASVAGSLETVEASRAITLSSEAVLRQDLATDAWTEYQSDSIKKHVYDAVAQLAPARAQALVTMAHAQGAKQGKVRQRALEAERARDRLSKASALHEDTHHWLAAAATLTEIAIALSTVAIITRRRSFWLAAVGLGVSGCALMTIAYLA